MRNFYRTLVLFIFYSVSTHAHTPQGKSLEFVENIRQWHPNVLYKADIRGGTWFLEKDGFSYSLYSESDLHWTHEYEMKYFKDSMLQSRQLPIRCHSLKVKFKGATTSDLIPENKKEWYCNYFLGNDPDRWASNVGVYDAVTYKELYPGINLHAYSDEGSPKYDFIVQAGADPSQIQINYEGGLTTSLNENGSLVITTSFTEFTELKPYAYQIINGTKKKVDCNFVLHGTDLSFQTGNYNSNYDLIIDPVVIASTFSGSTATTYGHSAAYDELGNIITGGRCFGPGYIVTLGSFDMSYNGGVDISISKLNPTGTARIYSTYIGGSLDEYVHSMYSLPNGDLLLYGSCQSSNYPTTVGCYDNTNNGNFDIIVTKLNAAGNTLIGSTYIGGSNSDGQNVITENYGDTFRGEIIADSTGEVYVATFSSSNNFPTPGGIDQSSNGGQDGILMHLNPTLTTLVWSTYIGGSNDDAAFGLRQDKVGFGIYVAGATKSTNFPTMPTALNPTFIGGGMDGFVMYIISSGGFALASSYIGTNSKDEACFLDADDQNNVYVYGVTDGIIPITPGAYGNPGGHQFMIKFPFSLNSILVSTTFGLPSTTVGSFSPTAFLVDDCKYIYMCGWGQIAGFATTPNAIPGNSNGSFYVIVLAPNAGSLSFATFYGAGGEHVDGGTSRFDKRGMIYEGVCAGNSAFPVLPGSVATTKLSSWDIAVFKIDIQVAGIHAGLTVPTDSGCVPFTANFQNASSSPNPKDYIWDFGDSTPLDTSTNPIHTYTLPGTYIVKLISIDSLACNTKDSAYAVITVLPIPNDTLPTDTLLCPGNTILLNAYNVGSTYTWSDASTSQTITIDTAGVFWVDINRLGCIYRDSINIITLNTIDLGPDQTKCDSAAIILDAGVAGATYTWSNGSSTQTISLSGTASTGTYWVDVGASGCVLRDSVDITFLPIPLIQLGSDTTLCPGDSLTLNAGNTGATYLWSNTQTNQQTTINQAGIYWVDASFGNCKSRDSLTLNYAVPLYAGKDTTTCEGNIIVLTASGSGSYTWSTGAGTASINVDTTGIFWVIANDNGCTQTDTVNVTVYNNPTVYIGPDSSICNGSAFQLNAGNAGSGFLWSTGAVTGTLSPTLSGIYTVTVTDAYGCQNKDTMELTVLAMPNVALGTDLSLCTGESDTLDAGNTGYTYLWSNSATTQTIIISGPGIYSVTVTNLICTDADTIEVTYNSAPIVFLGSDTTLCPGDSLLLNASNPGANYQWSNTMTSQQIYASQAGFYWVDASYGNCHTIDSLQLEYSTPLYAGKDTSACEGTTLILNALGSGIFSWSTGSNSSSINVNTSGFYVCTTSDGGCIQIDSVEVTINANPTVDIGPDSTLCSGMPFMLSAGNPGASYQWSNGAVSASITPVTSGFYTVTITDANGCQDKDTMQLTFLATPNVNLGADFTLCEGMTQTLNAGNPGLVYLWSTNEISQSINVSDSGNYAVTVNNQFCSDQDTVHVSTIALPVVDLGKDTTLCPGDTLMLDAGNPGLNYLWSTGSTDQQITVNSSENYVVAVSNMACTVKDSIEVTVVTFVPILYEQSLCNGMALELNVESTGSSYLWSTGENTPSIIVTDSGTYWVKIQFEQCSKTDTITVTGIAGLNALYIPSAFTPNGDGKNDILNAEGLGFTTFKMQIFNRWGAKIFESTNPEQGWDGQYEGEEAPVGIYSYLIRYKTICVDRQIEKTGKISILR